MTPVIEVQHLTKTYTTYKRGAGAGQTLKSFFRREEVVIQAVNDISFSIGRGEICGILGPNGAGKSTAIKMLCGALYPTSGDIRVLGYSPARDRKHYVSQIGAVFGQKSQLIWDIPPLDSFNMNKAIYGIPDQDYKDRLEELAVLLDITHVIEKPTRVLSLGERMKCEFVMAMLHRPDILFLDEPTIGLDVIAKAKIREFIRRINQKQNMTCILTTHDLEDVEELAHRVIVINHGDKVFDDSLQRLKHFLGDKKRVSFTFAESAEGTVFDNAYTRVIERPSALQITLEVDTAQISISDFLESISRKHRFSDISVKELPIQQVVMNIYESGAAMS
ncbi:ATP-binding cassette domain-containing protein [Paenibacillus sp. MMS20-IR301]|uniref:ABC transporter ATP-binding protein n=1 Tax=Paenibacillus sp. MMS20-IR301 TaxID=2895946 RepID=UPI0028E9BAAC|nr:ATP-binding cassette domain-containing protein [Paenibacillus sp. MMS20-IR301]WNS46333.1 ATP-binding cassette domain-containing protein [Paenibacillus sp. MMS20-IR301]